MKTSIYIALAAAMIGLGSPVYAGWLTNAIVDKPTVLAQQSAPAWTIVSREHNSLPATDNIVIPMPKAPVVNNQIVGSAVVSHNTWLLASQPVYVDSYVKTAEEAKILNPKVIMLTRNRLQSSDVPEPASVVGLSTGLFGLFLQTRRLRRRK